MEQLAATPVTRAEVVLGKLLPYVAIGLVDVALTSALGVFLFGVPFRGSVAAAGRALAALPRRRAGPRHVHLGRGPHPAPGHPDRHGRDLPAGLPALGLHVRHRDHAAAAAGRHLPDSRPLLRGRHPRDLPQGRGGRGAAAAGPADDRVRRRRARRWRCARSRRRSRREAARLARAGLRDGAQGVPPDLPRPAHDPAHLRLAAHPAHRVRLRRLDRRAQDRHLRRGSRPQRRLARAGRVVHGVRLLPRGRALGPAGRSRARARSRRRDPRPRDPRRLRRRPRRADAGAASRSSSTAPTPTPPRWRSATPSGSCRTSASRRSPADGARGRPARARLVQPRSR